MRSLGKQHRSAGRLRTTTRGSPQAAGGDCPQTLAAQPLGRFLESLGGHCTAAQARRDRASEGRVPGGVEVAEHGGAGQVAVHGGGGSAGPILGCQAGRQTGRRSLHSRGVQEVESGHQLGLAQLVHRDGGGTAPKLGNQLPPDGKRRSCGGREGRAACVQASPGMYQQVRDGEPRRKLRRTREPNKRPAAHTHQQAQAGGGSPHALVAEEGHNERGAAHQRPGGGGPGPAMVHHAAAAWEEPAVGGVVDEANAGRGRAAAKLAPPPVHHRPDARLHGQTRKVSKPRASDRRLTSPWKENEVIFVTFLLVHRRRPFR
jgi:hypothetical protein